MNDMSNEKAILVLTSIRLLVPAMKNYIVNKEPLPESVLTLLSEFDNAKGDDMNDAIDLAIYSIQSIDQILARLKGLQEDIKK